MSNKKILIVEDDPDVRRGMHVRLQANHYDTFFAADGMASIAEARKHMPDLIILDLGLPAGDGFSVMERLKANDSLSLIPVIVVSARDVRANQERALKAGRRPFSKNRWRMPNSWRSSGRPWENRRSGKNLPCMTWDPYNQERFWPSVSGNQSLLPADRKEWRGRRDSNSRPLP